MEKENIIENENEEVKASNVENEEVVLENNIEEATNNGEGNLSIEEGDHKDPAGATILANSLDQIIMIAASALLVFLCDTILRVFGYRFVQGNGAIILAGAIVYFILNCIYSPIMEKTKLRNTIARKILSV